MNYELKMVVSDQTNPYLNIAVENWLVSQPSAGVTLYLWKNRRTVVIGRNQNPFGECDVERLERDGGFLMRRKTGGGTVYHDDGNINFSFVAPPSLYDQERQFSVVRRAVESFGLRTELSGRNDVLCDGRKFSGNAFSKGSVNWLHHGTILIKGDMADLERYLKPKPAKLRKHGVDSVRSRVVNLSELCAEITGESLAPRLAEAFELVYGARAERLDFAAIENRPDVTALRDGFADPEWIYGCWRSFTAQRSGQFEWGEVELSISVDERSGVVTDVAIASDALDVDALDECRSLLTGASLSSLPTSRNPIVGDILSLIRL